MKAFFASFVAVLVALSFVMPARAQRAFGTQELVLDDGLGHKVTINLTSPSSTYTWTLPSAAPPANVPSGTTNNSIFRWDAATPGWLEDVNILATSAGALTAASNINTTGGVYQIGGSTVLSNAGTNNLFAGVGAGAANNPTATQNTAVGTNALLTQSYNAGFAWGSNNVAVGFAALYDNQPTSASNGLNNTAIGVTALKNNTTGSYNTASGTNALYSNLTGDHLTAIGFGADITVDGLTNATAIGAGATVGTSNTIQLGNSSVTDVYTFGNIHTSGTIHSGSSLVVDGVSTPRSLTGDATTNITTTAGDIDITPNSGLTAVTGGETISTYLTVGTTAQVTGNANVSGVLSAAHIVATTTASAPSANGGVTVTDVPVFVITPGAATANFVLTMPGGPPTTGDMIVVINQSAWAATFSTTASVPSLGSRTFYYTGGAWQ